MLSSTQSSISNKAGALAGASYSDISSLQNIKSLGSSDAGAAFDEIGRQFESMLLQQMLKSMRQANKVFSEGNLLSSNDVEFYQQMLDDQLSLHLSNGEGLGFREQLADNLSLMNNDKSANEKNASSDKVEINGSLFDQLRQRQIEKGAVKSTLKNISTESVFDIEKVELNGLASITQQQLSGSKQSFVNQLMPVAREAAAKLGVNAESIVAQAALETGWGKFVIKNADGASSHNLFGIKAQSGWNGDAAKATTLEFYGATPVKVAESFRAYDNFESSVRDLVTHLKSNNRYAKVLGAGDDYAQQLQDAGYATDPKYAEKIQRVSQEVHRIASNDDLLIAGATR